MSLAQELLLGLLAVGIALGLYAWLAPRRKPGAEAHEESAAVDWTAAAGDGFENLSDAARCGMVFAMAELDDDRSRGLLEAALDDRSDAVALAAAHALATNGRLETVRAYAAAHPGPRGQHLLETISLLG
jgi:hypothetical protein